MTRRGVPVGELIPVRRRRFASREQVTEVFASAPHLDRDRFRTDLDRQSTRARHPVAEAVGRGLIDTSVVIDLDRLDPDVALRACRLRAHARRVGRGSTRQRRSRRAGSTARSPATGRGRVRPTAFRRRGGTRLRTACYAAVAAAGRKARGPRAVDLLIAATALANDCLLHPQRRRLPLPRRPDRRHRHLTVGETRDGGANAAFRSSARAPDGQHRLCDVRTRLGAI